MNKYIIVTAIGCSEEVPDVTVIIGAFQTVEPVLETDDLYSRGARARIVLSNRGGYEENVAVYCREPFHQIAAMLGLA